MPAHSNSVAGAIGVSLSTAERIGWLVRCSDRLCVVEACWMEWACVRWFVTAGETSVGGSMRSAASLYSYEAESGSLRGCSPLGSLGRYTIGWGLQRALCIGYTACALPGRLMAGRQTLDLVVVVRIHPRVKFHNPLCLYTISPLPIALAPLNRQKSTREDSQTQHSGSGE
jgi:hypothetical protein